MQEWESICQVRHRLNAHTSCRGIVHNRDLEFLFIRETSTRKEEIADVFAGSSHIAVSSKWSDKGF